MRVLSIDGGGYLGLATAAFIEEAERHFGAKFHDRFDMFCGTSTGAIIALALAAGLEGKQIRELYEDFGPKVFRNRFRGHRALRAAWGLVSSRYGNEELKRSLGKVFQEKTLQDIHTSGKRVVVTAFCLTTGRPRIFKTNHGPGLTKQSRCRLSDIALASSAAPVYLPIVEVEDPETKTREEFCDGGVFANHPALIGFTEALYHCGAPPVEIKVLSLSTPRASLAEHLSAKTLLQASRNRGAVPWAWSGNLSGVFIDSTSMINHETLRRLAERMPGTIYDRIMLEKPDGVEMDTATEEATETLKSVGADVATQGSIRTRLQVFLNAKGV